MQGITDLAYKRWRPVDDPDDIREILLRVRRDVHDICMRSGAGSLFEDPPPESPTEERPPS